MGKMGNDGGETEVKMGWKMYRWAAQQVKACSNTPPTAGRVYEPAPRPEGEEQKIRGGGDPEKTQHDSACCFSQLAYTALSLNTFTHQKLPISILDVSHAELVDRHLAYRGSQEGLNHVRACIHHLPNHCVADEKGRLTSWILSDGLCKLSSNAPFKSAGNLTNEQRSEQRGCCTTHPVPSTSSVPQWCTSLN
ncbi:hypothetical protein PAMP_011927 [Pampus punctatissimus]